MSVIDHSPRELAARQLAARNHELLKFRDPALNLAYRIARNAADAEDILQEAYLRAVKTASPLLVGNELRNWFFQVTVNTARDWLRSENRRRHREREVAMDARQNAAPAESTLGDAAELKRQVEAELNRLDDKLRLPISLHYEHGMSYEDAAAILGLTPGTLRVYASQGIQELRNKLASSGRTVTAEILLAVLGAGLLLKASPALAASVEAVVAQSAGHAGAAVSGGKPLLFLAESSRSGWMIFVGISAAVCVVASWAVLTWIAQRRAPNNAGTLPAPPFVAEAAVDTVAPPVPIGIPRPKALPEASVAAAPEKLGAVDFRMAPDIEATWAGADELIPLAHPARYTVAGKWEVVGNDLAGHKENFSRVAIPYLPPEEYDYRIDFTRMEGAADVNMIFPAGGSQCIWRMETWNSACFGNYKGNPDSVALNLANGVRHTAVVEVRRGRLTAFFDGRLMKSIEPGKSPSLCEEDYRLPDQRMIGVGIWRNETVFHRIAVRAVTGKGAPLPEDNDTRNALSEAYWNDALNVLPATVAAGNSLNGKWSVVNGTLVGESPNYCRYQIDYAPPEEYDFRVVFTRNEGHGGFAQILAAGGTQFLWKIDSGGMSILDSYRGLNWHENPTFLHTPNLLANGVPHSSVVCIRKSGITVFVDGKLLLNRATDFSDFSIEELWKIKSGNAIGLAFNNCKVTVEKAQIKEVTGKGARLPAPSEKKPATDAF